MGADSKSLFNAEWVGVAAIERSRPNEVDTGDDDVSSLKLLERTMLKLLSRYNWKDLRNCNAEKSFCGCYLLIPFASKVGNAGLNVPSLVLCCVD